MSVFVPLVYFAPVHQICTFFSESRLLSSTPLRMYSPWSEAPTPSGWCGLFCQMNSYPTKNLNGFQVYLAAPITASLSVTMPYKVLFGSTRLGPRPAPPLMGLVLMLFVVD